MNASLKQINEGGYGSIQVPKDSSGGSVISDIDSMSLSTIEETSHENHNSGKYQRMNSRLAFVAVMWVAFVAATLLSRQHEEDSALALQQHFVLTVPPRKSTGNNRHKQWEEHKHPLFYDEQLVDHFPTDPNAPPETWSNRYYISSKYFGGPGSPIFVVFGGEGPVDEVYYPFVFDHMAKEFNAFVLQTEHRFYGVSQPIDPEERTTEKLLHLLTAEQAMADAIQLIRKFQTDLGCSLDRYSEDYCPVITVGASYPGFLSAMMRFVHPEIVDIGYASSAPIPQYGQDPSLEPYAYYTRITETVENAVPGCADAVKSAMQDLEQLLVSTPLFDAARKMGICTDSIPKYITNNEILFREIGFIMAVTNANFNMGFYPPQDEDNQLYQECEIFLRKDKSTFDKFFDFFLLKDITEIDDDEDNDPKHLRHEHCYELWKEYPDDDSNPTISASDWSGVGDGDTGTIFEFQTCTDFILANTGMGPDTMFYPARNFTLEWLTDHCQKRFGVTPTPTRLEEQWGFNDMVGNGGSYLLLTNGLKDGWSSVSITEDLSDTIVAINFPNGAHHSELNGESWPHDEDWDTDDIKDGWDQITELMGQWLIEVREPYLKAAA